MSSSRYVLCMVCILCLGLGAQGAVSSETGAGEQTLLPKSAATPPPLYIIQPSDILDISVWKEPTISRSNVLVRPDGRISISLAQDVQAAGLSPTELKAKLEDILKEYINVPVVTVIVSSIQSYVVYVQGNVARSGPIMSQTPLTVLQALTIAGGFTQFAKKREVVIIRGANEDTKRYNFNFDQAVSGENFSQNESLKSGDVIYVP